MKKALHRIFYAACLDDARDEAKQFLSHYSRELATASETLARHLEECLTFYRFPERHWKHIRTSNVIERAFNLLLIRGCYQFLVMLYSQPIALMEVTHV